MASSRTSTASIIRFQAGGKAALVAHRGVVAAVLQNLLERVERLRAHAQRLREALRAHRHDHEFLKVHGVVGMHAAVQHVHHGHGQHARLQSAQIAIERRARRLRRGAAGRHGDGQDGVGAQLALVGGAVERDHALVDFRLVAGVVPAQIGGDHRVDVVHGLRDALAQIAPLVAVAQFHRLVLARRGAGGNRRAAKRAVAQNHVRFHGGIAA